MRGILTKICVICFLVSLSFSGYARTIMEQVYSYGTRWYSYPAEIEVDGKTMLRRSCTWIDYGKTSINGKEYFLLYKGELIYSPENQNWYKNYGFGSDVKFVGMIRPDGDKLYWLDLLNGTDENGNFQEYLYYDFGLNLNEEADFKTGLGMQMYGSVYDPDAFPTPVTLVQTINSCGNEYKVLHFSVYGLDKNHTLLKADRSYWIEGIGGSGWIINGNDNYATRQYDPEDYPEASWDRLQYVVSNGKIIFDMDDLISQYQPAEVTAIEDEAMPKSDAPAYNLQGVKVSDNASGIIIKDGKKFMNPAQ